MCIRDRALVTFIQKGLQYIELESQVNQEDEKVKSLRPTFTNAKDAKPGAASAMEIDEPKKEPAAATPREAEPEPEPAADPAGESFNPEDVLTLEGHTSEVFMLSLIHI
eukprot:TRINITY_DN20397_c0_g1_i1.p3 TRINITY_DN20397_c0_g1~~TRINITY_DN20397_c0_g1_i1.p3  ORF type:complete len:109 (-),score=53.90 TRINITY_DN20397_c0_g1_i1:67-393(-)